ncbi:hypothetical protein COS54_00625 [Candidatus Shapirobacteria bacterium CG03_land_8_20_14_0_80_39_12]|uniref:Uncharacterized protein n=1 Tax=Candidatus Shapirobacteria bacterium CG03_land_8_20_14_0_80_39_12 TaxID=1974879 RepID=A0A2M7BF38_9BACT|nr:MAG: hypothetical protein COS54_00625 [Candidatus Shapirobacteria bacterium CG03_land_8_20_14_0_80_39_12]
MTKRNKFEKTKKSFLVLISVVAFLIIGWLLFYGKIKAFDFFTPILGKVPKDESSLIKATEDTLGAAVEKIKGGEAQKTIRKGGEIFETSTYTQPARNVRDDVKAKIDETIQSAKELPAKELKQIQYDVCRQWLGDQVATQSSIQ